MTEEITLLSEQGLSDETWQTASDLFDEDTIAQIIMQIVTINAWNRIAVKSNNLELMSEKKKRILYWISTIWLALGMTAGGVQQLLQIGGYVEIVSQLGYPLYLLSILGFWKILGVVAILIPGFPLVKEWAYAGFFFAMSGAAASHFIVDASIIEAVPSLVLLTLIVVSRYFRPANRKFVSMNEKI